MADRPDVKTLVTLRRNEIAKLTNDPRMREVLENLASDVGATLPQAIADLSADSESLFAARAFLPHPDPRPPLLDGASPILAAQIFGA